MSIIRGELEKKLEDRRYHTYSGTSSKPIDVLEVHKILDEMWSEFPDTMTTDMVEGKTLLSAQHNFQEYWKLLGRIMIWKKKWSGI